LLEIGNKPDARRNNPKQHPAGWVPGVNLSADGGFVVTDPRADAPQDWQAILSELLPPSINAAEYEVVGESVEVRAWDSGDTRLYYFKARIRRAGVLERELNLDDLIAAARKVRKPKMKQVDDPRAYWVQITDLQSGQADGDGVEGMISRALEIGQIVKSDLEALRKAGRPASQIFIPVTGDLVEGVWGWYAMQTFSVTLDRRDQVKLVRRLLSEVLIEIASNGLPVHVAVVGGNHGENRKDGKAYTTLNDNDDVAIVEQIQEAFSYNEALSHVTFSIPAKNRLSLTVEVLGWVFGLTHGHLARGGTGVEGRILAWFKSMAATRDPIGDAHLLFTGHYHHARFQQLIGDTMWIQGGALCDTSEWFSQSAGLVSDPVLMRGTTTAEQAVEQVMPFTWQRTKA
jgi:hypothetical protein